MAVCAILVVPKCSVTYACIKYFTLFTCVLEVITRMPANNKCLVYHVLVVYWSLCIIYKHAKDADPRCLGTVI